jgi:hypothetical protein
MLTTTHRVWLGLLLGSLLGCGSDGGGADEDAGANTTGSGGDGGGGSAANGTTGGDTNGGSAGSGSGTSGSNGDGSTGGSSGSSGSGSTGSNSGSSGSGSGSNTATTGGEPPAAECASPVPLYDTSKPTAVIGTGTAASCTGAALKTAAEKGGTITFNCGTAPATINLDSTINLPINANTIIDGEGRVTLDAQQKVRHFIFNHPDWMNGKNKVVLQRLTLRNGLAPAGNYTAKDPAKPKCAYGYKEGSGGALFVRNGIVHILDSAFYDNTAATEGPDVGGGAIYVTGVPEVVISGSIFKGNRGANGGAVGMLFANPDIYNSVFEDNSAEGIGQNSVEPGCPTFNHEEQGGAGGNAGAVVFDGLNDENNPYVICGSTFRNNAANELGGALFRTPNAGTREMQIDRCLFEGNTARMGGVSFLLDNDVTVRASSVIGNSAGVDVAGKKVDGFFGGLWVVRGSLTLENSTLADNDPSGLNVEDAEGKATNATFVRNETSGVDVSNSLWVETSCGSAAAGANNVQWPQASACASGTTFANPMLGALGDHGGPTPTFVPGATAAVAGVGKSCPATDQRGQPRTAASCAAGAVEP